MKPDNEEIKDALEETDNETLEDIADAIEKVEQAQDKVDQAETEQEKQEAEKELEDAKQEVDQAFDQIKDLNKEELEDDVRAKIEKLHNSSRHKFHVPTYKRARGDKEVR